MGGLINNNDVFYMGERKVGYGSDARLQRFFNAVKTPILFARLGDFKILDCNEEFKDLVGTVNGELSHSYAMAYVNYKSSTELIRIAKCMERCRWLSKRYKHPLLIQLNTNSGQSYAEIRGDIIMYDNHTPCWGIQIYPVDNLVKMNENLLNLKYSIESSQAHLESIVEERTKELQKSQEKTTKIERLAAIGETTAVVAHELRNPLGTINNNLYALNHAWEKANVEKASEVTDRMVRAIRRCDRIIEQLLNFTRTTGVKTSEQNFNEFISLVIDDFEFPEHIKVITDLNSDEIIRFGKEKINGGIVNIIQNALDAISKVDRDDLFISIRTYIDDGVLYIEIENNGSSIKQHELEKIFEPLYSTKAFGVGIGLATTRKGFEEHGGDVFAYNTNDGVVFRCHMDLNTDDKTIETQETQ